MNQAGSLSLYASSEVLLYVFPPAHLEGMLSKKMAKILLLQKYFIVGLGTLEAAM